MIAIKYINRLKRIDQLIRLEATGNPKELATKLNISERQLYRYINDLKETGVKIIFNHNINSYTYLTENEINTTMKKFRDKDLKKYFSLTFYVSRIT